MMKQQPVNPDTLTAEQIDDQIRTCRGDKAQAESMIADCHLALCGNASARRRICAAINARASKET